MPSLIHTLLPVDSYRVTEDSGVIRDSDALFATASMKVIYRGTHAGLINKFPVGKQMSGFPGLSGGAGESSMLCGGPQGTRLYPGTASDPHWECDVQWVGIHKKIHGADGEFIYRIEDECARTETEFPKKFNYFGADSETTVALNHPYVSKPVVNYITGAPKRGRIIAFVPTKHIIGVMLSTQTVSLAHIRIFNLIKTFQQPDISLMRKWWPSSLNSQVPTPGTPQSIRTDVYPFPVALAGSTFVPDPLWTWAVKYMESASDETGAWVPTSLQVRRQLSVGNLQAFTLDVLYEQRVQPG